MAEDSYTATFPVQPITSRLSYPSVDVRRCGTVIRAQEIAVRARLPLLPTSNCEFRVSVELPLQNFQAHRTLAPHSPRVYPFRWTTPFV